LATKPGTWVFSSACSRYQVTNSASSRPAGGALNTMYRWSASRALVTSPVVTSPVVTSPVVTSPVVTSPVVTSTAVALAKQGKSYIICYGLTRRTVAAQGYTIRDQPGGSMAGELAGEPYEKGTAVREEMLAEVGL
jgi:hypothetical protein